MASKSLQCDSSVKNVWYFQLQEAKAALQLRDSSKTIRSRQQEKGINENANISEVNEDLEKTQEGLKHKAKEEKDKLERGDRRVVLKS